MKTEAVVSTLDLVEVNPERRSGNTTRQIDAAIQALFDGHTVELNDHFKSGGCRESNKALLRRTLGRLWHEHRIVDANIIVNWNKCTIKFR